MTEIKNVPLALITPPEGYEWADGEQPRVPVGDERWIVDWNGRGVWIVNDPLLHSAFGERRFIVRKSLPPTVLVEMPREVRDWAAIRSDSGDVIWLQITAACKASKEREDASA